MKAHTLFHVFLCCRGFRVSVSSFAWGACAIFCDASLSKCCFVDFVVRGVLMDTNKSMFVQQLLVHAAP